MAGANTHENGLLELLPADGLQRDVKGLQARPGGGGRHDAQTKRGHEKARVLQGLPLQGREVNRAFDAVALEEEKLRGDARGETVGKEGGV
jgi:hypothetical protein